MSKQKIDEVQLDLAFTMNQIILIIFLLFTPKITLSSDYENLFICRPRYYATSEELESALDEINFHYVDAFIFAIIGPIALAAGFFIIVTFIVYPQMREPPGDIFFALSISEVIITFSWMIQAERFFENTQSPPENQGWFCQTNGYLTLFFSILDYIYNCVFCIFMILKVRNILKQQIIRPWIFHISAISIAALLITYEGCVSIIGKSIFGPCALQTVNQIALFEPLILIPQCLLGFTSILYFEKAVPRNNVRFKDVRSRFLNYYKRYIMTSLGINTVYFLSYTISIINCYYWRDAMLTIFLTVGNISRIGNIVILSIIRFQDPFIKEQIRILLRSGIKDELFELKKLQLQQELSEELDGSGDALFLDNNPNEIELIEYSGNKNSNSEKSDSQLLSLSSQDQSETLSNDMLNEQLLVMQSEKKIQQNLSAELLMGTDNNKCQSENKINSPLKFCGRSLRPQNTVTIPSQNNSQGIIQRMESLEESNSKNFFTSLTDDLKMNWIYTMMVGVIMYHQRSLFIDKDQIMGVGLLKNKKHCKVLGPKTFKETKTFQISRKEITKGALKQVYTELRQLNFDIVETKMTVIAPEAFEELRMCDNVGAVNLEESFNLTRNEELVRNASVSAADGGKGGEFFFFSYDNRVIMKTLSKQDFDTINIILQDYYGHFQKHPDSLIARFIGFFIFENIQTKKSVAVILMKNLLTGFPRSSLLRSYDVKGSTYSRQVLKDYSSVDVKIKNTLKDVDFIKLEGQVHIKESRKQKLLKILQRDAKFFQKHFIMDYSFMIFKVDQGTYFNDLVQDQDWRNRDNIHIPVEVIKNKAGVAVMESITEPGVFYHFGVIDYLQRYNLQKALEKVSKKVLKMNLQLDTSSQNPQVYVIRFCKFMEQIVMGKKDKSEVKELQQQKAKQNLTQQSN